MVGSVALAMRVDTGLWKIAEETRLPEEEETKTLVKLVFMCVENSHFR